MQVQATTSGVPRQYVIFPGQGSQSKGMGRELFDSVAEFRAAEAQIDAILGYSLRDLCLNDRDNRLGQTQYTQPCLYVVNALHYYRYLAEGARVPDGAAGHSLGEYNALLAAGAFSFVDGLKLVQRRGALMARATGGGMAAVLGLSIDAIEAVLRQNGFSDIDIANFNSPAQVVISGPTESIRRAAALFGAAGATLYKPLAVSAAFHSRYMDASSTEFLHFLSGVRFEPLRFPVLCNASGAAYTPDNLDFNKTQLALQIKSPVRWVDNIEHVLRQGATEFKELGPGQVLTRLVAQIRAGFKDLPAPEAAIETAPATALAPAPAPAPVPVALPSAAAGPPRFDARRLGSQAFRDAYGLTYAYMGGAMYKGIASVEMVVALCQAGCLASFGAGGLSLEAIEAALLELQRRLGGRGPQFATQFAMNLLANLANPDIEQQTVDLYLRHGVRVVEASAFLQITAALVRYRLAGISRSPDGQVHAPNRVIAKVSRPEVARAFMQAAPERLLQKLLAEGAITPAQAALAAFIPMADDICVEADSGGHTDAGVAATLIPAILALREELGRSRAFVRSIRIGAAGGIGTPQAAAAAFMLGADFIVTGSINQCSVEAGTSGAVKTMLQAIGVQDTAYAPAGDMFEFGARVQVMKKGVFFPVRANKLYDLYLQHGSIDDIAPDTRRQLQDVYFERSFEEVWNETRAYFATVNPAALQKAEANPKHKMAMIFKWYFAHTSRLALEGAEAHKVSFQVHCGPALGAFNGWVKGSPIENWTARHVDDIARRLMDGSAAYLGERFAAMTQQPS